MLTYAEVFQLCLIVISAIDVIVSIIDLTQKTKKK